MKLNWFLLIVLLFVNLSCVKEKPFPLDARLGNYPVEMSIYQKNHPEFRFSTQPNLGSATHLYLGTLNNEYKSRIMLQFSSLPDTVTYTSAQLILRKLTVYEDITGNFTAQLYKLNGEWDEYTPELWHDVQADSSMLLALAEVTADSSVDSVMFDIDPTLVAQWADTNDATPNYGVWINAKNAPFMVDFYTRNYASDSLAPALHVTYTTNDNEVVSKYIFASKDLAVLSTDFSDLDPHCLLAGQGIAFNSYLKFEIDQIPDTSATVNKALLRLVINRNASVFDSLATSSLRLSIVANDTISPGHVEIDTTISSYSYYSLVNDTVYFRLNTVFQSMLSFSDVLKNRGFLISMSNNASAISRVALYSSDADTTVAPRVDVVYSLPPQVQ
jgi:hypothetical protein